MSAVNLFAGSGGAANTGVRVKLALVTETYPPEVNGVAMTLSRLVNGLRARGHDVEVVRPRQAGEPAVEAGAPANPQELIVPGVPIPRYDTLRFGLPVVATLRRRWGVSRPDLVHVATEGPLGLAALWAARQLGLAVTSSFHTNFHHYSGHYGVKPLQHGLLSFLRWFHNATRLTLVPTAQMSAELAEAGFERLGVMSRGVDTALFDPARRSATLRASWGAGAETPVVAYVGRMAAEKNLRLAVEAFRGMQVAVPEAKFVLVGDGPERAPLARASPEFHYAGMRRGEDLAAHYASADLFLFPSTTETFGNVVTEALASGLVVVAYDYAATREHVRDGVNGFAATFDDPEAFRRVAIAAMAQRAEWPRVRAAARETALGLTWSTIVERFERQISEAARIEGRGVAPTSG